MIEGPYHLFSTGLLLILSYLISLLLVQKQILQRAGHRKFWNTLMLIFFLSTATLGLLLVVKVNYKLNLSWLDSLIQWHVDLGVGFALVAFFHLSWHLKYYTRDKTSPDSPGQVPWTPHISFTPIKEKLFFLLLGYVSIMAQLVLLREFVKTLHGNELFLGIFLALWMLMTAAGSHAGSKSKAKITQQRLLATLLFMGSFPLLIYLALLLITRWFFLPGIEPGMLVSIITMAMLTGPLALCSGFLFAYTSKSLVQGKKDGSYYRLDSIGSLAAGFLFGLVLVFFLDNVQALSFLFLMTGLALVLAFQFPRGKFRKSLLLVLAAASYILLLIPQIRTGIEAYRFQGERLLETRDTPHGNLAITENEGQVTAYLDRTPVLSTADLAYHEERIHYAALQHPGPKHFLLMGNGLSGSASEIDKYSPLSIDYCESDPWVIRLGIRHFMDSLPEHLNLIPMDGRKWLIVNDSVAYDVIISVSGDPLTLGWNRFYTREFFTLVRNHLRPGGIFSMQLSSSGSYIDNQGSAMLSINWNTLAQVFEHVAVIPGNATTFLASDSPLSLDIPGLLAEKSLKTTYVHPDYLDLNRLTFDSDQLMERINTENPNLNLDLHPRLFFSRLKGLESIRAHQTLLVAGILGALIFLYILLFSRPGAKGMYVMGFSGAGIQIMLIMVLQALFGFAYMLTPLMITLFMLGIVLGTIIWKFFWGSASLPKLTGLIVCMALFSVLVVLILHSGAIGANRLTGMFLLGILNVIPGLLVGSVYGMSALLADGKDGTALGRLFSADLAGAALGSFVPVVFLLPLIGVTLTFILFCGINVLTGLYLMFRSIKGKENG